MFLEENKYMWKMTTCTCMNGTYIMWIDDDRILNTYRQHIIHNNVAFIWKLFFFLYSKLICI